MIGILFVDDESNILDALKRSVRPFKEWRPAFAQGGVQALALLENSHFDVIVTDMRMPGMDGLALLEKVAAQFPNIFRFILSGQSDSSTLAKAAGISHQYLSKPCNLDVLRQAVERAVGLRERFGSPALLELMSKFDTIPSAPTLYVELTSLLEDESATMDRIAALIAQDPGMCARILQVANSSLLGLRRNVSNLAEAVGLLGFNMLQNLALTVHVFRKFEPKESGCIDVNRLWQHSFRTSRYAGVIARSLSPEHGLSERAQVAGLLHDVGHLLIACNIPRQFAQVATLAKREGLDLLTAEKQILGANHAEVGAYILALWGLPDEVTEAILYHHRATESSSKVCLAVHAADALDFGACKAKEGSIPGMNQPCVDSAWLAAHGLAGQFEEWGLLCKDLAL